MNYDNLCLADTIAITPRNLSGGISAIASKSAVHRLLISAALGRDISHIFCKETNNDIDATVSCLQALGADISRTEDGFDVIPLHRDAIPKGAVLHCGESGSTLRFLLPVAAALQADCVFVGEKRLPYRPMTELIECLRCHGAELIEPEEEGRVLPLHCRPGLTSGNFSLRADISSQFISGLLFALPLLQEESTLTLRGTVESRPYIAMTLSILRRAGISLKESPDGGQFSVSPSPYCLPQTVQSEGDWSNAAFFLAAGALGGEGITVNGIFRDSEQGDKEICRLLSLFGAKVIQTKTSVTVYPRPLRGITVDVSQIPDLVPILSVVAAAAEGETVIQGAARLRLKESDRLKTTTAMLTALGASVVEEEEGLRIWGGCQLQGGTVHASGDHRIAMSAAIASLLCSDMVRIQNASACRKSYPRFFEDFTKLGGLAAEVFL